MYELKLCICGHDKSDHIPTWPRCYICSCMMYFPDISLKLLSFTIKDFKKNDEIIEE